MFYVLCEVKDDGFHFVGYFSKEKFSTNGNNLSWNAHGFSSPEATRADPHYFDNPYWMRNNNFATDSRDRFIGNMVLNYENNDWLSVKGRVTNDN